MGGEKGYRGVGVFRVIGFLIILLLSIGCGTSNATDSPFSPPTFSFTLSAMRGAAPLTVIAQPIVSGETGDFAWDWDGDGDVDLVSHYKTQHQYTETGEFDVNAWLYADSGRTYEADKKVHISVTNSFTGPSGTVSDTDNHDWSTAENLPLGATVYRHLGANSYHFYTLKVYDSGDYMIKTWGLDSASQSAGAVVTLYSSIGFVKVRSGASVGGKFGYMVVPLDKGTYTVEVINYSSAINYGLAFSKDTGERPTGDSGGDTGDEGGTTGEGSHPGASVLNCGDTKSSTLSTVGDWYQFTLSSDAQVTITTTRATNSLTTGAQVTLYDASDSQIATDGGATTFGTISRSLTSGTYYVLVKAVEGSIIGSYSITLTCANSEGDTPGGDSGGGNGTLSVPTTPTIEVVQLPDTGPTPAYPLALHADKGMYTLLLGTGKYSSPVDVYVVATLQSGSMWIFKKYGNEAGLTTQVEPYVANSTEPTDGTADVLIKIPSALFPSGTTTFYLLVVNAGTDLSKIDWEHDGYLLQYFSVIH